MLSLSRKRPDASEYIPYFAQYVALVPDDDIVTILERQITDSATLLASFTPEQAKWRPAPGEWSAAEIVGHLADTERVFAYRALRIARADPLPWTPAELEGYVEAAHFNDQPLHDLMAEFAAVRIGTVALLDGIDDAGWARRAPEDWSCRSVGAIAYIIAGHELHHRVSLQQQREAAIRAAPTR